MPSSSNRLFRFWQELKRRNVPRLMAIYAGTSYVIFEASTLIFPRWGLPDWTIDLVLYLLILGAIITFIVTWIYDITPEGVQKTKSFRELQESEVHTTSNAWKIATYVSFVVIIGLVTFNIIGSRKGIRPGDIQSLVILPFDNLTGDDRLNYVAEGLHASLIGDMGRISSLRVISKTTASVYKKMEMSLHMTA